MAIKYVIIKNLMVNRAHAMQGEWILSAPSVCSWGGLINYLEDYSDNTIKNEGFNIAYIQSDIEKAMYQFNKNNDVQQECKYLSNYGLNIGKMEICTNVCVNGKKGDNEVINLKRGGVTKQAPIKIIPKMNYLCHVVIRVRSELNNDEIQDIIYRFLEYDIHIGGGFIHSYDDVKVISIDTKNQYNNIILRILSEGWTLVDASNELETYCNTHNVSSLQGMMYFLKNTYYEDGTVKYTDYVPQTVGYNVIQEYNGDITRDEEISNYFCENLITVCKKVRVNKKYDVNNLLWQYQVVNGKEYKYIMIKEND